jgi:hypothetical protein
VPRLPARVADIAIAVAPPPPVKAAARPRTPRAATGTPTRVAATSGAARHIDDVWSAIVANEGATFTSGRARRSAIRWPVTC